MIYLCLLEDRVVVVFRKEGKGLFGRRRDWGSLKSCVLAGLVRGNLVNRGVCHIGR